MSNYRPRDVSGQRVVVTGGTSGLGVHVVAALTAAGARVTVLARDGQRGADLTRTTGASCLDADLARLADVDAAAQRIVDEGPLDLLVLNAGIMGGPRRSSADGLELQMAVNHFAHARLVAGVMPALLAAADDGGVPRVVSTTSIMARRGQLGAGTVEADMTDPAPYHSMAVYSSTKQANQLYARRLRQLVAPTGIRVLCAHPGIAVTGLVPAQLAASGAGLLSGAWRTLGPVLAQSAEAGARPILRAALDPDATGEQLYGPSGPGQIRGEAIAHPYPRQGCDDAAAGQVWSITRSVVGVPELGDR